MWDALRTLLEVARDLSLSDAARRSGLDQADSRAPYRRLEEALGVSLFTRLPRGLNPTPAAIALAPHAEAMAVAAAVLARSASSEAVIDRGVVCVMASEIVGAEVLISPAATPTL